MNNSLLERLADSFSKDSLALTDNNVAGQSGYGTLNNSLINELENSFSQDSLAD